MINAAMGTLANHHARGHCRIGETERGTNRGQDTRLEFTYYGGQQIRINDIEIELGIAGS